MVCVSRNRDRARIARQLETEEYKNLLIKLQDHEPFLRQFNAWSDVLAFMHQGASEDPNKDEILRPILAAHVADGDHRWRTILLAVFWPGLGSIHFRKRSWDLDDPDELWQRVYWAFHQSVCRIDIARRRDRLVQWIYNSTIHRLHEDYRRDWVHAEREIASDPEEMANLAGAIDGVDPDWVDLRDMHRRELARLQAHLDAGRITEPDFLLLVGTRLYGQSISEYARDAGLKTEAAKKRRQRAEAAIRSHEKEMP